MLDERDKETIEKPVVSRDRRENRRERREFGVFFITQRVRLLKRVPNNKTGYSCEPYPSVYIGYYNIKPYLVPIKRYPIFIIGYPIIKPYLVSILIGYSLKKVPIVNFNGHFLKKPYPFDF